MEKIESPYKINFTICLTVLILSYLARLGFAEPLSQTISGLQKYLNGVNGFEAYFVQKVKLQSFDQPQNSYGKVYIKKPGMMKWEYQKPDIQTIIINKQQVWIYTPEDQQVIKTGVGGLNSSAMYDLFLSDNVKINKIFDFYKGKIKRGKSLISLELRPKNKDINIARIILGLEKKGYQIKSFENHDKMGNVTTIIFNKALINGKIDNNIFDLKVPDDVEIITSEDLGVSQ